MFGAFGGALHKTCVTFVSQAAAGKNIAQEYGLQKIILPVKNCRNIGKKDMVHNDSTPEITVNPETYEVTVDGQVLTCEPATVLPLAQRYFLF